VIFDTNVILHLIDGDGPPAFHESIGRLVVGNDIVVNEIIFAEVAGRYAVVEQAIAFFEQLGVKITRLSLGDCHRAGRAFKVYRSRGGVRSSILPDFLIGAQAANRGWPIVTRDRKGFATYFPEVELIDPYTDSGKA
jgi:predicted nucleic acid-binding protein